MDARLGSQLGLHRVQRHAVADLAAVAAALADFLVDHREHVGFRLDAALALAALLGGALLVVDQHRHARRRLQLLERIEERLAAAQGGDRGQTGAAPAPRLLGNDDDFPHPFRRHAAGELRDSHAALRVLAACHGHGAVVEQLERDIHPRRHAGAQGLAAGVEVRAVADVLEDVPGVAERRRADPRQALAAHLGQVAGVAHALLDQPSHAVAANAAAGDLAVQHAGRAAVRTAGAVVGLARHEGVVLAPADGFQHRQPRVDARRRAQPPQARSDTFGDDVGVQFAVHGKEGLARFGGLAQQPRRRAHAVQAVADLAFQEVALFLDHNHFFQAARKAPDAVAGQRVDHPQVQNAHAQPPQRRVVQPHVQQRLPQVRLALAGADQPHAGVVRRCPGAVQAVGGAVGAHRGVAVDEEMAFQLEGARRQKGGVLALAEGLAVDGHFRDDDLRGVGMHLHHAAAVAQVGDQLQADPAAAEARQGEGVQAVEQEFLDGGRVEDGDAGREQDVVALVRHRGALAIVVVAGQDDGGAVRPRAAHVGVLEDVAAAVDAGALAIPNAVHPVDLRAGKQVHVLGAHHRRGGQFLVHRRLVHDAVLPEQAAHPRQREVIARQRRALIAGNEGARLQPVPGIAPLLVDGKPHQGLDPGQVNAALQHGIFVVKRDRHQHFSPASARAGKRH